jgi:hypothetical protein
LGDLAKHFATVGEPDIGPFTPAREYALIGQDLEEWIRLGTMVHRTPAAERAGDPVAEAPRPHTTSIPSASFRVGAPGAPDCLRPLRFPRPVPVGATLR